MPPTSPPAADEPSASATILVVDDDPLHQTLVGHILRAAGFDVCTARDGAEALASAERTEPDLILLDARMPEMDGFGMLERLRREPALETLPTLMVSGCDDRETRRRAFAAGVDDFIVKPVDGDDLVERVRAQLRVASAWQRRLSGHTDQWPDRARFERWLAQTIETAAFDMWFQPIVDLRSGEIVAQEALARFHDGSSPAQVFEMAATSAASVAFELALVDASVTAAAALPDGTRLHVNVSPPTAAAPELPELIDRSNRQVALEMTERSLFDPQSARHLRDALPAGSLLAADDVGVGYSGLSQLLDVRPDIVKIDRSVVAGLDADPARRALVAGLVRFAEATGSTIVGEGIERVDEARSLLDLGVTTGQGYLLGRPAPIEATMRRDQAAADRRGSDIETWVQLSSSLASWKEPPADSASRQAMARPMPSERPSP